MVNEIIGLGQFKKSILEKLAITVPSLVTKYLGDPADLIMGTLSRAGMPGGQRTDLRSRWSLIMSEILACPTKNAHRKGKKISVTKPGKNYQNQSLCEVT